MAPKQPDWTFLESLSPDDLEDDDTEKVRRQCQIRVRFESGVKTKFLAALNQLLTSFFQCHDIPWSHSFPKRYDMYIVKING